MANALLALALNEPVHLQDAFRHALCMSVLADTRTFVIRTDAFRAEPLGCCGGRVAHFLSTLHPNRSGHMTCNVAPSSTRIDQLRGERHVGHAAIERASASVARARARRRTRL